MKKKMTIWYDKSTCYYRRLKLDNSDQEMVFNYTSWLHMGPTLKRGGFLLNHLSSMDLPPKIFYCLPPYVDDWHMVTSVGWKPKTH